jgi:glycerol kinase
LIEAMEKDSGLPLKELRVDGGASRSEPLLQSQADLVRSPVIRPKCIETTALGAAYLAGLAVGFWKDQEDIVQNWQEDVRFMPKADEAESKALQEKWNQSG